MSTRCYIRVALLKLGNLKNKGSNTPRNNMLNDCWAKSLFYSLKGLIFHSSVCLATLLTRQTLSGFSCRWPNYETGSTGLHSSSRALNTYMHKILLKSYVLNQKGICWLTCNKIILFMGCQKTFYTHACVHMNVSEWERERLFNMILLWFQFWNFTLFK